MIPKIFRPMLAYKDTPETDAEIAKLIFPMFMSPKIDGIRGTNWAFDLLSRSGKKFPSAWVNTHFGVPALCGIDGELTVGDMNSPTVFSDAYSALMTQGCQTPMFWNVFDVCRPQVNEDPYEERLDVLQGQLATLKSVLPQISYIRLVDQEIVRNWDEVLQLEQIYLAEGFEGGILRSPSKGYKFNRSTLNGNELLKIKRFETCEAVITGFVELEHNDNEAYLDERGYTKRTSHQENKRGGNTLGALEVRDCETGVDFKLGSGLGLDERLRKLIWDNRPKFLGRIVSYKKLKVGEKDKPRNCTFRGFRDPIDM